jgi:hypothetical protein
MPQENLNRPIVVYLIWLGLTGLTILLFLAQPKFLKFASPEYIYHCLLCAELIFILIIWPMFLDKVLGVKISIQNNAVSSAAKESLKKLTMVFMQVVMLFVLAFPLAIICYGVSNGGLFILLKIHIVTFVMALFVVSVFYLNSTIKLGLTPWYYLFMFLVSAGLPFLYYIGLEYLGKDLIGLSIISPFWAVLYIEDATRWISQIIIFGSIALLFLLIGIRRKVVYPL